MPENQDRVVGGYAFLTDKDAQIARQEEKKIEYLEARIDYNRPESVLYVYRKSLEERMFRTPVGLEYMRYMRDFLMRQESIDPQRVPTIPLNNTFDDEVTAPVKTVKKKPTAAMSRVEKRKQQFMVSVILNIVLVIAMIAMFSISLSSENPNIFNYEKNLTNKYATWEQELTEREQVVREKERELLFTE